MTDFHISHTYDPAGGTSGTYGQAWVRPDVFGMTTPTGVPVAPGPTQDIVASGERGPGTNVGANPVINTPQSGLKPRLPQTNQDPNISVLDIHDPRSSPNVTVSPNSALDIGTLGRHGTTGIWRSCDD